MTSKSLKNTTVLIDMYKHAFHKFLKLYYPDNTIRSYEYIEYDVKNNFNSWLWKHGAVVRRKNKKYFLEFLDDKKASVFILKYLT